MWTSKNGGKWKYWDDIPEDLIPDEKISWIVWDDLEDAWISNKGDIWKDITEVPSDLLNSHQKHVIDKKRLEQASNQLKVTFTYNDTKKTVKFY